MAGTSNKSDNAAATLEYEVHDEGWRDIQRGRKHRAIQYGIFAVVALVLAAGVIIPMLPRGRNGSYAVGRCAANLRQISLALRMYAADNRGEFPPLLSGIQDQYRISTRCFLCSSSSTVIPTTYPSNWVDANSDYIYLGAGLKVNTPPKVIIAYDRSPHAQGHNVIHVDGSRSLIPAANISAALQASSALRQTWVTAAK